MILLAHQVDNFALASPSPALAELMLLTKLVLLSNFLVKTSPLSRTLALLNHSMESTSCRCVITIMFLTNHISNVFSKDIVGKHLLRTYPSLVLAPLNHFPIHHQGALYYSLSSQTY
jgi:hypothetical protein